MSRVTMKAMIHRTAVFALIWAVLSAGDPAGQVLGLIVVPATVWLSVALLPARNPLKLWRLTGHAPRFLVGSVAGGVDVARRAFAPSMPLNPGWLRVPMQLGDGARVALGAELSLMPGTLAAGSDGSVLLVHVLDLDAEPGRAVEAQAAEIAALTDPAPEGP